MDLTKYFNKLYNVMSGLINVLLIVMQMLNTTNARVFLTCSTILWDLKCREVAFTRLKGEIFRAKPGSEKRKKRG